MFVEFIRRGFPNGLLHCRYLLPRQPQEICIHRNLWRQGQPPLPGPLANICWCKKFPLWKRSRSCPPNQLIDFSPYLNRYPQLFCKPRHGYGAKNAFFVEKGVNGSGKTWYPFTDFLSVIQCSQEGFDRLSISTLLAQVLIDVSMREILPQYHRLHIERRRLFSKMFCLRTRIFATRRTYQ